MRTAGCECCGKKNRQKEVKTGVYECGYCRALYGTCYLGESYAMVRPWMSDRTDMTGARYFDFVTLGSKGVERRHGWFDPETRLVLQVG